MTAPPPLARDAARPTGLADVYRAHAPTVMRWASRLLGHSQDAADVTQEVFLVVHRRLPEFVERGGTLETWLFRITRNVVRSRRRAERVRGWFAERPEVDVDVEDRTPGPAELLESKSDRALVNRALAALKETDRELLVLFELEGYSGEKVAELLELSPKVIWVRLYRARARFLEALRALAPEVAL